MHKMQHITEKELDILRYFYLKKSGHVRQIQRFVKISEHTLLKYLSNLEKRSMLLSKRIGNLKLYEVNSKSDYIKVFYAYFDLERLQTLDYKRKKAVQLLIASIKNIKLPYFILLFGSTAKSNYTEKSDIDVILVHELLNNEQQRKIEEAIKKIQAETGLRINSISMELEEFIKEKENKENYALQDAIAYGYPVFGNQLYYEVV